ncbi:MAG: 3-deoxy-D-manno-octulosonic acid transferase [Candidatus Omnitrophica bacterium]|nr:3-deoxy-D-manno-octulosonic acid transferase [Candidatus Omnitrophota bacterium]
MKYLYNFVYILFALFSLPKFFVRLGQAGSAWRLVLERFGFLSKSFLKKIAGRKVVWLHAVSVGEVIAARRWVELFLEHYPGWTIVLSTTTPTGQEVATSLVSDRVLVFYAPLDLSFVVKRVLKQATPKLILLMETEIWPNLISEAETRGIPIGIVNGRISPRSFQRYQLARFFVAPILEKLAFCLVQSKRDWECFSKLGVSELRLFYTGNMKFDQYDLSGEPKERKDFLGCGVAQSSLILIGGSTHWNEEELLLRVFERLRTRFNNLQLILAPRHPEHLSKVVRAITNRNLPYRFFSAQRTSETYPILVVDRMGVLASLYSVADTVFMGGSFVRRGGQSPIEAAFLKKPIVHGPNVFNFDEIYQMLDEHKASFRVHSEEELYQQLLKLLESPELRGQMGARAWSRVQSMKGATARTLDYLSSWIQIQEEAPTLAAQGT